MKINLLKQEYNKHKEEIKSKLQEFNNLEKERYKDELFFCLLTPQSKAEKCWQAVEEIKKCKLEKNSLKACLKTRTRFYMNKTRYLIEANKHWEKIKKIISSNKNPREVREKLIKEVKGLGMKEASHFLRNIGKSKNKLAILDRHILEQLKKLKIIKNLELNKKNYLLIEKKMSEFSRKVKIKLDELDLLFWKIESGRIFK